MGALKVLKDGLRHDERPVENRPKNERNSPD